MAKQKYYVVLKGEEPGIYDNWNDCKVQVDGFKGAIYKSFKSLEEAQSAFNTGNLNVEETKKEENKITSSSYLDNPLIDTNSICVDGACSGNPGKGEYQCVDMKNGDVIFSSNEYLDTTNNIMEYFALVEAIKYILEGNCQTNIIYSDSQTAISWVKNKKVKTTLGLTQNNYDSLHLIEKYNEYIKSIDISLVEIKKWDTKEWGEIPADFGRK
jgi:ribonuclease HI